MSDGYYTEIEEDEVERIADEYRLEYHGEGWASDRYHAVSHKLRYYPDDHDGSISDVYEKMKDNETICIYTRRCEGEEYDFVCIYPSVVAGREPVDYAGGYWITCESCGKEAKVMQGSICNTCYRIATHEMPDHAIEPRIKHKRRWKKRRRCRCSYACYHHLVDTDPEHPKKRMNPHPDDVDRFG